MPVVLVVVEPFADYVRGDRIVDPDKIKVALEHQRNRVVQIVADDHEEPETA